MDIGSAFTYMFDDQDWIKKIAIGGGITLVAFILTPILIGLALFLPLSGYMLETLKSVRDGRPAPLPEWTNFGDLFSKGLMIFVIYLVYNLPAILFSCVSGGISVATTSQDIDPDLASTLGIVSACASCLQVILSLLATALLPGAIIRYAGFDSLGAAFQFAEIFNFIKNNVGDYVIVVLLGIVTGLIAGFGLILCIVGIFFTFFWSILVSANLYGQLARKASSSLQSAM
ncbi:MAG: DUF4013 domain-containing protein [Chloroflexi bacterium]|nr:DUF4013 domain-containing protein [Chloroflexota bacterium]